MSTSETAQAALLSEMPMLLYKRVRLTVEAESHPAPAAAPEDAERRFGPVTSDPADAERNIRAKEDAERAAYLSRWKEAPKWADYRTVDGCGQVRWWPASGPFACEPRPVQGVGP